MTDPHDDPWLEQQMAALRPDEPTPEFVSSLRRQILASALRRRVGRVSRWLVGGGAIAVALVMLVTFGTRAT